MKTKLTLFLAGVALIIPAYLLAAPSSAVKVVSDSSDYTSLTAEAFFKLPKVNQSINVQKVDVLLLQAAVFHATNLMRVQHNKALFKYSAALTYAAQQHSEAMTEHRFFSHTSVVSGQEKMTQRLALVGIKNAYSGENIAQFGGLNYEAGKSVYSPPTNGGYFSYTYKGKPILPRTYANAGKTVTQKWMDSPGHRRNILNANFKYLGTGMSIFKKSSFYDMPYFNATQNFSSVSGTLPEPLLETDPVETTSAEAD